MPADGVDRFGEETEFQEAVEEQLKRMGQRQRLERALKRAQLKEWTLMLQVIEGEDSEFADFLRFHPELARSQPAPSGASP